MELKLVRKEFYEDRTISDLYVDGVLFCQVLEDVDRGLDSSMSKEVISKLKVYGKTAIPYGKYVVVISYSNRFEKLLPELLSVAGYGGIRIHPGNYPEDTEGCLLPGIKKGKIVANSRATFKALFAKLKTANAKEKITIEITKG